MRRYVAIARPPRAWDSDEGAMTERPSMTVYEPAPEPRDTGLIDAQGVRIYAFEEREPIGFRVRDGS